VCSSDLGEGEKKIYGVFKGNLFSSNLIEIQKKICCTKYNKISINLDKIQ
jgi:hypothetical protein